MLAEPEIIRPNAMRPKPSVVLAVLLLAVLQLTTATHQFDHTANELGEVCAVCLQLERLDDIDAADSIESAFVGPESTATELTPILTVVSRHYSSQPRAPPLS